MTERRKIWGRAGQVVVVGLALGSTLTSAIAQAISDASGQPAQVQGGEGGEGGEGEGRDATTSPVTDDVAYLGLLGLVRGHLAVGVALYEADAQPMALMHMKHPGDELYQSVKPAMDARGAADFAAALTALSDAVSRKAPKAEVLAAHARLEAAVAQTQSVVATSDASQLATVAGVVLMLVRTAADEYALGVVDGEVVNAHEYQDAWGFTTIAKAWLDGLTPAQREAAPESIAAIAAQVDGLLAGAWPSVVPPERVDTDAQQLYGAAARIELELNALR